MNLYKKSDMIQLSTKTFSRKGIKFISGENYFLPHQGKRFTKLKKERGKE